MSRRDPDAARSGGRSRLGGTQRPATGATVRECPTCQRLYNATVTTWCPACGGSNDGSRS